MADKGLTVSFDTRKLERRLNHTLKTVKHPRKLMKALQRYVNAVTFQMFNGRRPDTSGRRGVKWPKLKQTTIFAKRALRKRGKAIESDRPLVRTGKMRVSLGVLSSAEIGFTYGTKVKSKSGFPYPGVHNKGGGKIPMRKWLFFTTADFEQMTMMTVDYLKEKLKGVRSYVKN